MTPSTTTQAEFEERLDCLVRDAKESGIDVTGGYLVRTSVDTDIDVHITQVRRSGDGSDE